jgi:hypothetical protein
MKTYLGDSVYATHDGYHVVLTTENGFEPSNTIALEPEVLVALDQFREQFKPKPPVLEASALPNELGARIKGALQSALDGAEYCRNACTKGAAALAKVAGELSPDVDFNPYGATFWFTVSKREDVQVLMKLAPGWTKNVWDGGIDYNATVDDVQFKIRTQDGALPPTCRLVEQDVEIPAKPAEPAKIVKRMVVECAKHEEVAS